MLFDPAVSLRSFLLVIIINPRSPSAIVKGKCSHHHSTIAGYSVRVTNMNSYRYSDLLFVARHTISDNTRCTVNSTSSSLLSKLADKLCTSLTRCSQRKPQTPSSGTSCAISCLTALKTFMNIYRM